MPSILTAAGTASAFGTVYAAHALYGFIGPAAAFVLLGVIGVATMLAAALHGPALAGLGLAGSLVVPLLVSSAGAQPVAARDLSRRRRRGRLCAGPAAPLAVARGRPWSRAPSSGASRCWRQVGGGTGDWASALFVHAALQLALAAVFMALEPHLATPDDAATPDWIATAALAALSVLAILALGAARASMRSGPCSPSSPWPSWR